MHIMHERCAGSDVHKKTVVACVVTPDGQGGWGQEIRTFGTTTLNVLARADWLLACGCTHVAIESTGDCWKPVFNILEATCEVLLVNAQPVQAVPGRKTDVKDAAWLAGLLQHGLFRASCIPPMAQRELRDLAQRLADALIRARERRRSGAPPPTPPWYDDNSPRAGQLCRSLERAQRLREQLDTLPGPWP